MLFESRSADATPATQSPSLSVPAPVAVDAVEDAEPEASDGSKPVPAPLGDVVELGKKDTPFAYTVMLMKTGSIHLKSGVPGNKKLPKDLMSEWCVLAVLYTVLHHSH